jgi:hypothetical protein
LNKQLTVHLAAEADKIENKWERSLFLYKKKQITLWSAAVVQYVKDTNFELYDATSQWSSGFHLDHTIEDLATMNLSVRSFDIDRGRDTTHNRQTSRQITDKLDANGHRIYESVWQVPVDEGVYFVINDTKVGATERAKFHWREKDNRGYRERVFVFEPIDRTKAIDKDAVAALFHNPPDDRFFFASQLQQKQRATGVGRDVTLLKLEERGGSRYHRGSNELVWRDAGNFASFDATKTYYYIPLSGYVPQFTLCNSESAHDIVTHMRESKLASLNVPVYGVRKTDHEAIKLQKNWINLETFLVDALKALDSTILMAAIRGSIDRDQIFKYNLKSVVAHLNDGDTKTMLSMFVDTPKEIGNHSVNQLMHLFRKDKVVDYKTEAAKYNEKFTAFARRYPLIEKLETYRTDPTDIANYINVIDSVKGV